MSAWCKCHNEGERGAGDEGRGRRRGRRRSDRMVDVVEQEGKAVPSFEEVDEQLRARVARADPAQVAVVSGSGRDRVRFYL